MKPNYFLMADIHGDHRLVREFMNRNPHLKGQDNILILLGDTGLNYYFNYRDVNFKRKLGSYPFQYFIIRGNHEKRATSCALEDPKSWDIEKFLGGTVLVEKEFPYIKYAMDFMSMYYIPCGVDYFDPDKSGDDDIEVTKYWKTLVIPGAYSVDKYKRISEGWNWFEDEQLSDKEQADGIEMLDRHNWKCDIVLSHTCPIMYEPTHLYLDVVNQAMVDKTMERFLGYVEYRLDYKFWAFGHFHDTFIYPRIDNKQMLLIYNNKTIKIDEWMSGEIGQWY